MGGVVQDPVRLANAPVRARATALRVRFGETDAMGVVYYANYIDWFACGRTELLRAYGHTYRDAFQANGLHLPAIEAHAYYRASAVYDDLVYIVTWVGEVTRTRIHFEYRVIREDGTLLTEGSTVHVFLDRAGKPVDLYKRAPNLWQVLQGMSADTAN